MDPAAQPELPIAGPEPSIDWPIGRAPDPAAPPRNGADAEAAPTFALIEQLTPIWRSPALGRFLDKRIDQALRHGHTPAADMDRRPHDLARTLAHLAGDVCDFTLGEPPPERLGNALVRIEKLGALAMALHDRVSAELAARSKEGEGR